MRPTGQCSGGKYRQDYPDGTFSGCGRWLTAGDFESHRVQRDSQPDYARRCLTDEELLERGGPALAKMLLHASRATEAKVRAQIAADIEELPIYSMRIGYEWLSPGGWQPSDRVISTVLRSDAARIARNGNTNTKEES